MDKKNPLKISDTTFRDGHQSSLATRMRIEDMEAIASEMDKAGLNVLDLKDRFGNRWSFNGNIDVRILASNDKDKIRREVLTKLNAAKGGGYIIQSDHSIPENVDFASYDYMIQLIRQHGNYPLNLAEFDEAL